jgi:ferredoxin
MDNAELLSCVFCPRLCRHVCPVAVGSGREAATPTAMMTGVWAWTQGRASGASAFSLASLCVSCGACTSFCKLHRPVPELLAQARAEIGGLPEQAAPGRIEGGGELVFALAELDAIDEIHLTWAGHTLFGGRDAPTPSGGPENFLPASREYELTGFEPRPESGECFLSYRRKAQ